MVIKRLHILLFLIAWILLPAENNNPIVPESHSFTFQFRHSDQETVPVDNLFIRELAKYNVLGLESTTYTFNYSVEKFVETIGKNLCRVNCKIQSRGCSGNVYYKGVSIADILDPEAMDLELYVVDEGNYFVSTKLKGLRKNNSNEFDASFSFETYDTEKDYKLELKDVSFYSDTNDKKLFYQRINIIDNYFAAIEAMDDCQKRIEKIIPSKNNLIENHLSIVEFQRLFNILEAADFKQKLTLDRDQLQNYDNKLSKLGKTIEGQLYFHRKIISEQEYITIEKSIDEIAEYYVDVSCYFNVLSEETSHANKTYFTYLGAIDFSSKYLNDIRVGITQIIVKTEHRKKIDRLVQSLQLNIYQHFVMRAKAYIEQQDFYLAKSILENASRFHQVAISRELPLELNVLLSKTDYGIFNSYLHLIDRAIEIGNYELAEKYLKKARDFQKNNSTSIITDAYLNKVSERLIELYINNGLNLNQKEVFDEAIYCFEQADKICAFIEEFNFNYEISHGLSDAQNGYYLQLLDSAMDLKAANNTGRAYYFSNLAGKLESKYSYRIKPSDSYQNLQNDLTHHVYLNKISEGKKLLNQGNYNLAYFTLLHALEMEEQADFQIYDPLPDLFARAAVPYLLDQCRLAGVKVNLNQLDEAKEMYDNCLDMQNAYGLNYEQELMAHLTRLNNDIFNQKCNNVKSEFDFLFARVNNCVAGNDFIGAVEFLNQTSDLAASNYFCDVDKDLIISYKSEYQPAAEYQQLAEKAQRALNSHNKEDLNAIYKRMEELSSLHEVIRKRIEPLPLHYLFSVKKNLAIFEKAIQSFDNQDDYEIGLKVMNTLAANQAIPLNDIKTIQESLAEKLAAHDRKVTASYNPQDNLEQYTGGDDRFRHFAKAYLKTR